MRSGWTPYGERRFYYTYILSNTSMRFYIGMTNNLVRRFWEHQNKMGGVFTSRYHFDRVVYFADHRRVRCDRAGEATEGLASGTQDRAGEAHESQVDRPHPGVVRRTGDVIHVIRRHPEPPMWLCHPEPPKPPQVPLRWHPAGIGGAGRSKDLKLRESCSSSASDRDQRPLEHDLRILRSFDRPPPQCLPGVRAA